MSRICADTSFLFSLVGNDAHTPTSTSWLKDGGLPISVSALGEYELGTALRFAECKKYINTGESGIYWQNFQDIAAGGRIVLPVSDLVKIVDEASSLSQQYVIAGGHRSFDVLLVASALVLDAEIFLTFDKNQRGLAQAVGLETPLEIT